MNPRFIAVLKIMVVLVVIVFLVLIFPKSLQFVEMAARELRYLWWLILLFALGAWLVWGLGSRKK